MNERTIELATVEMIAGNLKVSFPAAQTLLYAIPKWEKLTGKQIVKKAEKILKQLKE
jgi:hypothetical protein